MRVEDIYAAVVYKNLAVYEQFTTEKNEERRKHLKNRWNEY